MRLRLLVWLNFSLLSAPLAAQSAQSVLQSAEQALLHGDRPINTELADSILQYAATFLGCRYGYGSCGPKSFDCSGFVMHVFGKFGFELPHGSGNQHARCEEIKLKMVERGDLLFFAGRKTSRSKIGHVAIVSDIDGNRITMIHATVQSGVITEVMQDSEYFSKRFICAGRIVRTE